MDYNRLIDFFASGFDPDDRDDLKQEAHLAILRAKRDGRPVTAMRIKGAMLDYVKRRKPLYELPLHLQQEVEESDDRRDRLLAIAKEKFNEDDYTIIVLTLEDYNAVEIAKKTGLTSRQVRYRLHQLVEIVKRHVEYANFNIEHYRRP